ncbi:MAG: hypothetical protein ACRDH0_02095 [Actinomycetota bacterium]
MGGVNKARHPGLLPISQDHRPAARPKGCCRCEPESCLAIIDKDGELIGQELGHLLEATAITTGTLDEENRWGLALARPAPHREFSLSA